MMDDIIDIVDNTLEGLGLIASILVGIEQYEQDNIGISFTDRIVDLSVVATELSKKSR